MSARGKVSVDEVRRLSQEEGLVDKEIADAIGCHRVTITRLRSKYDIPRPNLLNRKDKKQECKKCGEIKYIRRKERVRHYCLSCKNEQIALRREKNKIYMRTYQK